MSRNGNEHAQGEGTSMEQVRELLFGSQMKEMETRMIRQDERFQQELSDAGNTLKQRLDSLENFMKSEVASLLGRLNAERAERESVQKDARKEAEEAVKHEQRERQDALAQAARDLASASEAFERKLAGLSQQLDSVERELRELLLTESTSLSNKTEERYQQALDVLRRTADNIRHDMVHRNALSGMFTETAVKLSGQWTIDVPRGIEQQTAAKTADTADAGDLPDA